MCEEPANEIELFGRVTSTTEAGLGSFTSRLVDLEPGGWRQGMESRAPSQALLPMVKDD